MTRVSDRTRTLVVAVLAAVVGIRVSVGRGLEGTAAAVAGDPSGSLVRALDGWSDAGTLGNASAADLRATPLALLHRLAELVGLSALSAQAVWTASVLVLAVVGARRLASLTGSGPARDGGESWAPWGAALVFACGPVLVTTAADAPLDGLVAALLPWVLLPVLRGDRGWRGAARSAAWLGPSVVAAPAWGLTLVLSAGVTAVVVWRSAAGQLLRWALLASLGLAAWGAVALWEAARSTAVTTLLPDPDTRGLLGQALGHPSWGVAWLLLLVAGPLLVVVAALVLRGGPPVAPTEGEGPAVPALRAVLVALLVVGALPLLGLLVGLRLPVTAVSAAAGPPALLAPALVVWVVAAVLAWGPVVEHLRWRVDDLVAAPRSRAQALALLALAGLVLSAVGVPLAARERPADPAVAGVADQRATTGNAVWRSVAAWSAQAPPGRVLVLPATAGRLDPVVGRALAGRPWIGRDDLPGSAPAATAALDDVLRRLARGQDGPEVVDGLRRLGVRYVLVRQDLGAAVDRRRPAGLVKAGLAGSGATRVTVLGAAGVDGPTDDSPPVLDGGLRPAAPRVEVWGVPGAANGRVAAGEPLRVAGDAGSTADLVASGSLGPRAVRLVGAEDAEVLSDSAFRRDVDQREAVDPDGPALTADRPRRVVPDGAAAPPSAVRRLDGIASVTASSSAADASGPSRRPGSEPAAVVDGNPFTVWQSRPGTTTGQWWQLDLDAPVGLAGTTVQLVQNVYGGQLVTRVRVTTDAGSREVVVPADGRLVLGDAAPTSRLRVTAVDFSGTVASDSFGIAEVTVPGLTVRDELMLRRTSAPSWVLASRPSSQRRCVPSAVGEDASVVCDPSVAVRGPDVGAIERVLDLPAASTVRATAWVRAADTVQAAAVADRLARPSVRASASSVAAPDLVTRAQAAVDDDDSTAWRPDPADEAPSLTLAWDRPAPVRGLRLELADDGVSARPGRVRVDLAGPGARRSVERTVAEDGAVQLPRVRADRVTVTLLDLRGPTSVDAATAAERPVPAAVEEVDVVGGPAVRYDSGTERTLPCGDGPALTLSGATLPTRVRASAGDLVDGRPVRTVACVQPDAPEGRLTFRVDASLTWLPLGARVDTDAAREAWAGGTADVTAPVAPVAVQPDELAHRWSAASVPLPGSGTRTVVLAVPAGTGWSARVEGTRARSVTVDGWAQGWVVPAGVERIDVAYEAGGSLRRAVGLGMLGWLGVVGVALGDVRSVRARRRRDQVRTGRSTHA